MDHKRSKRQSGSLAGILIARMTMSLETPHARSSSVTPGSSRRPPPVVFFRSSRPTRFPRVSPPLSVLFVGPRELLLSNADQGKRGLFITPSDYNVSVIPRGNLSSSRGAGRDTYAWIYTNESSYGTSWRVVLGEPQEPSGTRALPVPAPVLYGIVEERRAVVRYFTVRHRAKRRRLPHCRRSPRLDALQSFNTSNVVSSFFSSQLRRAIARSEYNVRAAALCLPCLN